MSLLAVTWHLSVLWDPQFSPALLLLEAVHLSCEASRQESHGRSGSLKYKVKSPPDLPCAVRNGCSLCPHLGFQGQFLTAAESCPSLAFLWMNEGSWRHYDHKLGGEEQGEGLQVQGLNLSEKQGV